MVKDRRRWLHEKLETRAHEAAARPVKEFVTGEGFHYLGRSYRLKLVDVAPASVGLVPGRLQLRPGRLDRAEGDLIGNAGKRGCRVAPSHGRNACGRRSGRSPYVSSATAGDRVVEPVDSASTGQRCNCPHLLCITYSYTNLLTCITTITRRSSDGRSSGDA